MNQQPQASGSASGSVSVSGSGSGSGSGACFAGSFGSDEFYQYSSAAVDKQRKEKPWEQNVRHFNSVQISTLAAMKMLKHSLLGVERGRQSAGGQPIEILGLMIGKASGREIIVLDACPLPVEGSETRVVADEAQIHMLELLESLEVRREESFIGWYHSHPFDLASYSHVHLSAVDVQTQTTWQNASPTWLALVVDPMRSQHTQRPEFGAFRVYPPSHHTPQSVCPDGKTETNVQKRTQRWGITADRYYSLPIQYFASTTGEALIDKMTSRQLWASVLSSSSSLTASNKDIGGQEANQEMIQGLRDANSALAAAQLFDPFLALAQGKNSASASQSMSKRFMTSAQSGALATPIHPTATINPAPKSQSGAEAQQDYDAAGEFVELDSCDAQSIAGQRLHTSLAAGQCKCVLTQLTKEAVFNLIARSENKRQAKLWKQRDQAILEAPISSS